MFAGSSPAVGSNFNHKTKNMKNPEKLIGRKVRGFKFDPDRYAYGYDDLRERCIGEVGTILARTHSGRAFEVHFEKHGVTWKYPADQIEAHLVGNDQPNFRKVWAWDDDVREAFETYLIAENKEKEYPFLCVSRGNVNCFKCFSPFHSSPYKNISTTDPRLNDIIAVVEKYGKNFVIKTVEKL
jgi:hypothetical protein